jgi:hypothetical protein
MSKFDGKWLIGYSVDDLKFRARNNEYIKGRNQANTTEVNMLRVDTADELEFGAKPKSSFVPSGDNDVVNVAFLKSFVQGVRDPKDGVRAASVGNTALSGLGAGAIVIDGVTLADDDRVLLKNQTAPAENGIYTIGNIGVDAAFTRAADANDNSVAGMEEVTQGMSCLVAEGAVNARKLYVLTSPDPIVIDTDAQEFGLAPNPSEFLISGREDWTHDGVTATFQLAQTIEHKSCIIKIVEGPVLSEGATQDFQLANSGPQGQTVITLDAAIVSTLENLDEIEIQYLYAGA